VKDIGQHIHGALLGGGVSVKKAGAAAKTRPRLATIISATGILSSPHFNPGAHAMPKYLIERELPGAGQLTPEQLRVISQKSCGVLSELGSEIQWQHSYVSGDAIHCVYIAPNEQLVREHARRGEFPVTRIMQVGTIIDPTTAE
jgi:hypothetical protein